ncbi:histone acetyltransferase 1 [Geosmithia morbida]|uniref:Histone acetyltransferase type B catalytic subunit n=1 Tax=Geosmithia morbida TaxID=1094350 RepID=A0A9P5D480_9HYPO|nr:histone acetyltransferase 1 [Geosmithia morbida]KAF4121234.1 histone acetyltransferase 1 [Geosmithia morbida]
MATVPDLEEWFTHSNDALNISLVAPSKSGLQSVAAFHPNFTYPIFGDEERIFGYQGLKINLRYRANDMRPHLKVSYSKKFKPVGDNEPTDIAAILKEGNHLPKVAFVKESDFEDSSKQLAENNWTPPGALHDSFKGPDGFEYEIWKGDLTDPAIKQLNSRVQIMVPLFIEGGSYIGQDPDSDSSEQNITDANRWTLFFLYRKDKLSEGDGAQGSSYVFVGYSTVYRFYWFQTLTPPASPAGDGGDSWELPKGDLNLAELPCRSRLSQFVILPPFQGKGHGANLYKSIFSHYHKHAQTQEFTVEDPNEAFDDLRDICDMEFLEGLPEFHNLRLDTTVTLPKTGPIPQLIVGGDKLEDIRRKAKIASRQFYRAVEMHLMAQLPDSVRPTMDLDKEAPSPTSAEKYQERLWQLVAKQRLYRHNKDALSQMDSEERIEKLYEVLTGVELGNARILAAYERAIKHSKSEVAPAAHGKRRLDDSEESVSSKKVRVSDA